MARPHRFQSGFSLVEALVVTAILATVGAGTATTIKHFSRGISSMRALGERDRLFERIQTAGGNVGVLRQVFEAMKSKHDSLYVRCIEKGSTPGYAEPNCPNSAFTNLDQLVLRCVGKTPADADCPNLLPYQIALSDGGTRLSGTQSSPARYNLDGGYCSNQSAASTVCPLEIITVFQGVCVGGAACDQALNLQVVSVIRQSPQIPNIPGIQGFLKPKATAPSVIAMSVLNSLAKDCDPATQIFAGLDPYGNPKCQGVAQGVCGPYQYVDTIDFAKKTVTCKPFQFRGCANEGEFSTGNAADGSPICSPIGKLYSFSSCPNEEVQYGNAADGSPLCKKPEGGGGFMTYTGGAVGRGNQTTPCAFPNPRTGKCECPKGSHQTEIFHFGSEDCEYFHGGLPRTGVKPGLNCGASAYICL